MQTKEQKREYDKVIYQTPKRREQLRKASIKYIQKKLTENPNHYNDCYNKHKERIAAYSRRYKDKIKTEVLTYYGEGKLVCVICKETRLPCLSLDHINNGGTQERKRLNKAGLGFYCYLKKNGYPEGYQTLCMNCQFIKREESFEKELERRKLKLLQ